MEKYKSGDWCVECQNTGSVNCYCGGDLCVCGQEEVDCPVCMGTCGDGFSHGEEDEI